MSISSELNLGAQSPTSSEEKNLGFEPRRGSDGRILTAEEIELAKLGYKQEFKREFSWISTFSFAFSISGLLVTVGSPNRRELMNRSLRHLDFHLRLGARLLSYGVGMEILTRRH